MFLIIFSTHSDTFVVYMYIGGDGVIWVCFCFLVSKIMIIYISRNQLPHQCRRRFYVWLGFKPPNFGYSCEFLGADYYHHCHFFSCAHNHVSIIFRRQNTDYYSIKETQKLWNWKNVAFEFFVGINFLRMECKVFFCMRLAFVPNTNYKTSMK